VLQILAHLLRNLHANRFLSLISRPANVRSKNKILHRCSGDSSKLFIENVECRRNVTLFQPLRQIASFTSSPRAQFTSRTPFFIS